MADEKPKYDKKIKSTKDVVDDKLKDKKLEYGQGHDFSKYAQELLTDLPKKANDTSIEVNAQVYACLKKYKGAADAKEAGKAADEIYDAVSKVVLETIGFDGFKPKNKDGEAELEDLVKSYVGNIDKKTLRKGFEERYTQAGYLDEKLDLLQRNMLNYPAGTFSRKREQRVMSKLEGEIDTVEGYEAFKKHIKSLAEKLNKPLTEEDTVLPNRAIKKWIELEEMDKKK